MIHLLLRYIGIKTKLLDFIKREIDLITPDGGGVLDMFAGSTVVGQKLLNNHVVYSNDIQNYSRLTAETLIAIDGSFDYSSLDYKKVAESAYFKNNFDYLMGLLSVPAEYERKMFAKTEQSIEDEAALLEFKNYYENAPYSGHFNCTIECFKNTKEVFSKQFYLQSKKNKNNGGFYNLFSLVYGVPYFSLNEAIFVDSFRYAIDKLLQEDSISKTEYNCYLSLLVYVLENTVTSVGDHFAQPQQFKISSEARLQREVKKILSKKTKDLFEIMDEMQEQLKTIKATQYSSRNRVFCCDYK